MENQIRLALIGANGMLAHAVKQAAPAEWDIIPYDLPDFDITNRVQVLRTMETDRPQVIVNCAAFTHVDGCETLTDLALQVNGDGPGYLAEAARDCGAILVHISTDYVFDGTKSVPYTEEDAPNPKSAYGRSKLLGETAILQSGLERFLILRTSWLYGPGGKNFVETIVRLASEREDLSIVADQVGSPTYTADLADAIFELLKVDDFTLKPSASSPQPYGIYHFSNEGQCSWHEFACAIVEEIRAAGEPVVARQVLPIRTEEYPLPASRPPYSVFSKQKYKDATGASVPDWRASLAAYFKQRQMG